MSRLLGLCTLLACGGDTGVDFVEVPLHVQGVGDDSFQAGDWTVQLSRADVAFGPAYFCATQGADTELCEVALAEYLQTETIDALDAESRRVGVMGATTGEVRSSLFDYGISWLLTDQRPRPRPGAAGGHSAVLEGRARRGEQDVRFVLRVDLEPIGPGDAAVNARRTQHSIDEGSRLTVRVDPRPWLRALDFDAWVAASDEGVDTLRAAPGEPAYEAVVLGMTVNDPVRFDWSRTEEAAP